MATLQLERERTNGSRRHMLDWVSDQTRFISEMSGFIDGTGAVLTLEDRWLPKGWSNAREARLETFAPDVLQEPAIGRDLRAYWLKHPRRANTPNWDLASTCTVDGRRGLLLVEAKAHRSELHESGRAEERVLTPADLAGARALYVGNSLRGLIAARLAS